MKMMKKNGGFTLVELIVVIAILAILAGVAIPAYSGYIKKAREAKDTQTVSAIKTALSAAAAGEGYETSDLTAKCTIAEGKGTITIEEISDGDSEALTDIQNDFAMYMNQASYDTGVTVDFDYYTTASWNNGEFTFSAN